MKLKLRLIIWFIVISILLITIFYKKRNVENFSYNDTKLIKTLCQTYHTKSKIPQKVYDNIKKYLPGFKHIIFDDNECLDFLKNFDKKYQDKLNKKSTENIFKKLKINAHKADLFRYCYLYENGGLYADIKTEFIKPVESFIKNPDYLYISFCLKKKTDEYKCIYQGVIYSKPKSEILFEQIKYILDNYNSDNYLIYVNYFYEYLSNNSKTKLKPELNIINNENVYIFIENSYPIEKCKKYDRYGYCSFIDDKNINIIKTRFNEYPW